MKEVGTNPPKGEVITAPHCRAQKTSGRSRVARVWRCLYARSRCRDLLNRETTVWRHSMTPRWKRSAGKARTYYSYVRTGLHAHGHQSRSNVSNALQGLRKPRIYGWLDSMVALHWIRGDGQYRQFVANKVAKIQLHPEIEWKYFPTQDNSADLASRSGPVTMSTFWWTEPEWLRDHDRWPEIPVTQASSKLETEAKIIQEVLCTLHMQETKTNAFDELLERRDLRRAL